MAKRILIVDGHPDPDPARLCHALADAYARGADDAGAEVRVIRIAELDFPMLRSAAAFEHEAPVAEIAAAQGDLAWAQHLLIVYPLWLGSMPALLKGFLEQLLRPGFAVPASEARQSAWTSMLSGRSARVVVTMGMPAFVYRWFFFAHSLRSLQRNILRFCGISPIRTTLIGAVGAMDQRRARRWIERLERLGQQTS
ncbi:MAG: NAD(P)H-dependent oxidoreductase [Gammaproteobacteria bacterium]|nr:NAD(P)H-dependent oxidoreductase [Gammaproteobacteria bacterium]